MKTLTLTHVVREQWLAEKLGLPDFDAGVTTGDQRRERIRSAILERGLPDAVCFKKRGRSQTYAEAFRAVFDSPLETTERELALEAT